MAEYLIVGAGFAGLRCALELQRAGHSVRVLEARDRVGGRTRSETLCGHPVDVGGQWIGRGHTQLRALALEAGAQIVPQYDAGEHLLHLSGARGQGVLKRFAGRIPKVSIPTLIELELAIRALQRQSAQIDLDAPWAGVHAAEWDAQTLASWARRRLHTRAGREIFEIAVRAVLTTEPSALSFLHFLFYCASNGGFEALTSSTGGAQAEVVRGGMPALAAHLAAPLGERVQLQEPVRAVLQDASGVTVVSTQGNYRAERVVMTVPPALLAQIAFTPELPPQRDRLARQMPMGSVIKAVIAYPRPFWREAGLSGEAVSHQLPFNTVFDASWPESRGGGLVGFFDGPAAMEFAQRSQAQRRAAVLDSLATYFGPQARSPVGYTDYNWIADPWARGCYVGVMPPGVMTSLGAAIRVPHARVHWAGTETATRWVGYIEGALESGARAANEILRAAD